MTRAVVVHTGFWTYLLIAAVALLVIGLASPSTFQGILDLIRQLSRAVRGG